jgi:hypothetical protein
VVNRGGLLIALIVAHVAAPPPAHAYLDPISGSVILQVLIAGVLGALLTIKRVSWAMRDFFSRLWKRITG